MATFCEDCPLSGQCIFPIIDFKESTANLAYIDKDSGTKLRIVQFYDKFGNASEIIGGIKGNDLLVDIPYCEGSREVAVKSSSGGEFIIKLCGANAARHERPIPHKFLELFLKDISKDKARPYKQHTTSELLLEDTIPIEVIEDN